MSNKKNQSLKTSLAPLLEHYRGKSILVTGHSGFKGGWLTHVLRLAGAQITGFSLTPENPKMSKALQVPAGALFSADKFLSIDADIRDRAALGDVIEQTKPEIIFHLAAQAIVQTSYDDIIDTLETNVMGTGYLLQAAMDQLPKCAFVIVTSDKVYENRETGTAFAEDDPLGGKDPYSASKSAAEMVVRAYRAYLAKHGKTGLYPIATVRAGNVIGGGDHSDFRLVPDVYRAHLKGEPAQIRMPHSVRPWQHVLEPIAGYLEVGKRLLEKDAQISDSYNFGPKLEDCISVGRLLQTLQGLNPEIQTQVCADAQTKLGPESQLLRLDINRAMQELNWIPRMDVTQALALTDQWFSAWNLELPVTDLQDLTNRQIREYFNSDHK